MTSRGAKAVWGFGTILTCTPILRLLSRESPSGTMKAVLRKAGGTVSGEEKQFLEVSLQG